MASVFTYQDEPHRVHSPWSTPGSSTPQIAVHVQTQSDPLKIGDPSRIAKLEPEKHDGPIEYKLHLLLRWRRTFAYSSTSAPAGAAQQGRDGLLSLSASTEDRLSSRPTYQPSSQTRQARLQQLTTQLLWRLQQSSPFHSSSNAKLVLPVLPEATPRLGVPDRPSKLLPGLEESQGALYEIGVADDGTLVGLADDELEESLTNLRAMAASLGCVVDVHRRVIVGDCEWLEDGPGQEPSVRRSSKLWVAEVLVRPDNKNVEVVPAAEADDSLHVLDLESAVHIRHEPEELAKQHLRVTLLGASAAGKSSLLGSLTTSVLDNGRGKSRLSLLKHRHEIASGITSSVAQELVGYQTFPTKLPTVINYATGDVSSWPDVHNLANRLVFLSDSPGLPRYAKSTFRALISWDPGWVMLCITADAQLDVTPSATQNFVASGVTDGQPPANPAPNLSLAHLDLCLKLNRPFVVVITKMDLATRTGLRQVLAHVLSITKAAGKFPVLINTPMTQPLKDDVEFAQKLGDIIIGEQSQIDEKLANTRVNMTDVVPIVMTSALTGSGIGSLHCLLRSLPDSSALNAGPVGCDVEPDRVLFQTDEVFAIPPSKVYSASTEKELADHGIVLCGILTAGTISLGDQLLLGPFMIDNELNETWHVRALRRASSHNSKPTAEAMARSLSEPFSKSLQLHGRHPVDPEAESKVVYAKVRVVSLRNLRLSVTSLKQGDTGTVGIQTTDDEAFAKSVHLNRARKGMVLTQSATPPHGYRSFTATFPCSDFSTSTSPPLILGGHAIAYINSVRAAVKVIAVALEDNEKSRQNGAAAEPLFHDEVFPFDEPEPEPVNNDNDNGTHHPTTSSLPTGTLKIAFTFLSTVEHLTLHDQVLIVPTMSPAGPISGPASTAFVPGLSGFIGRISDMSV